MKKVQTPLFQGITENEWNEMQNCSCMRQQSFEKNELIFRMGESVREIGIVLTGSVNIENVDFWGNKSLLSNISAGQVFAETYAFCQEPLMVNAVAAEYTNLLFLNLETLMQPRYQDTLWTDKIMQNLLRISIYKNLILSNRIFCTTPKTIRGRLLIYLSSQASKAESTVFQIPFNRQELADYLNLDRSTLSKELGKMRDEGILEFRKSQFVLHQLPE